MIPVGAKVRIVREHLRETNSEGIVKYYDQGTQWYSVELNRTIPPFRGEYEEGEIQEVKA